MARSARSRQLTKSEFFREMFRSWEKQSYLDPDSDEATLKLFAEEKEKERQNPTPLKKRLQDFEEIREDLQKRARLLGITVTEDGEIVEKARI